MKVLKLSKWTICASNKFETVQQQNTLVLLDSQKHFIVFFGIDENGNIRLERCSPHYQCEIDHEHKTIVLEEVE